MIKIACAPVTVPRATVDDLARGVVVPPIVTPLLDALGALHHGREPSGRDYLSDADELHRVVPVPLDDRHCRAEMHPGSGIFCGRHKGHDAGHQQRGAEDGAVWDGVPAVDERSRYEVMRDRAETAEKLLRALYTALGERAPEAAHSCSLCVATCEGCDLDERVRATLGLDGAGVDRG